MAVRRLQFTPNARPTTTRTPSKNSLDDAGLYLQQVIGTTSTSSNGFDYLQSTRSYAFLAGAGAVLVSIDDDLRINQRFFRAKPSLKSGTTLMPYHDPPTLPGAPQSPRKVSVFMKRDGPSGFPGSPSVEQLDSLSNRATTSKERTKAASCVCLSPNGKLLALGEVRQVWYNIGITANKLKRLGTSPRYSYFLLQETHHQQALWPSCPSTHLEFIASLSIRTLSGLHHSEILMTDFCTSGP